MKNRMKMIVLLPLSAAVLIASCQSPVATKGSEVTLSPSYSQASASTEARRLTGNLVSLLERFPQTTARSASDPAEGPVSPSAYFENLSMVDRDGRPMKFRDLSPEEQKVFLAVWIEKEAQIIEAGAAGDQVSVASLKAVNDALESTLTSARNLNSDWNTFQGQYQLNVQGGLDQVRALSRSIAASRQASGRSIYDVNPNSWAVYKNNYANGRVLVGEGSSSGSATVGLGHSGLYSEGGFSDNWDANSRGTTSSWGSDFTWWAGATNGVQKEPVGSWTSTDSKAPARVRIFKVGNLVWVWNWWSSGYQFNEADGNQGNQAASNAVNKIGLPFNAVLVNKWDTSAYYCSSLVWRSWYEVSSDYDIDRYWWDAWVAPIDHESDDSRLVADYWNY